MTTDYEEQNYWNKRYETEREFDWYMDFETLYPFIRTTLNPNDKILNIGCGNSSFAFDMLQYDYKFVTNIDISDVVINKMKDKYKKYPSLEFFVQDTRKLTFSDSSFETIIDKGTLDTLICGKEGDDDVDSMMKEIYRILKPGGKFILLSHAPDERRLEFFQRDYFEWNVKHQEIQRTLPDNRPAVHYLYIASKNLN
ncbi:s-adenosyl-l-methionine-dependent methyltransferases superfamily protein [Anaeramoeba ignava]|uniref:S-adenosyl-l-methionine-dependent methyltransferases superfamily protein n=1 Tax=Anaeramoeba ignava TaxID=1746090 RepID=A0A9Q0LG01_ANAIG|nr:s-adenosyl-l-methionine-dependent methyltransferases superfamily protein [Anaeramoeba ignava]